LLVKKLEMQQQSVFSPITKYSSINNDNYNPSNYDSNCMQCVGSSDYSFQSVGSHYDSHSSTPTCIPQGINNDCHGPLTLALVHNKKTPKKLQQLAHNKDVNISTEEYKQKRERNNIAVRKSREKAKKRLRCNETRINELLIENEQLKKRTEVLSKLLNSLRLLLNTFGYSHDKINFEVSKSISQQPTTSTHF
jgi:hypothetical protein